ncbi:MAG: heme ABC transporter ATP-binding protein [Myxococcota bacterium]
MRGGRALLSDVSVSVEAGTLTAFVGPNGAGKTTLMRVLAGELAPDSGAVVFGGRALASWSAADLARRRAVLPQRSELAFAFRVDEVVAMGRFPFAESGRTTEQHVRAALEAVGMASMADRSWLTLSGGERQRVQLARVLAQLADTPDGTLFLDEPTNHLDLTHQLGVLQIVRARVREGATGIAVLHDLTAACRVADRVVLLAGGRVVAQGEPGAVLRPDVLRETFRVDIDRLDDPRGGVVLVPRLTGS